MGEYYHIYNRGTDRRDVFLDDEDRQRFVKLLFVANGTNSFVFRDFPKGLHYTDFKRGNPLTAIGAFCLMDNHFHILAKETTENGISAFVLKTLTSYSHYFNKKYERKGRLFQGTFQAQHADTDEYLKYLFAYIHLNPVKIIDPTWKECGVKNKKATKEYLENYRFSSFPEYTDADQLAKCRNEAKILTKEAFPEYFLTPKSFDAFVDEWLMFRHFIL